MKIHLGHGHTATWEHGSHYVNISDEYGHTYDCVSFAWDKDTASFMDAWASFYRKEYEDMP